jgi:hypothetical protein
LGLLDDAELQAIAAKARKLAKYNSMRNPRDITSNWIRPGPVELFAVTQRLLTHEESEFLSRR